MTFELTTPPVDDLGVVIDALRDWQHEGAPMQLHPGDIGWFWRFGDTTVAASIRTWRARGRLVAVGLLDGADVFRMTLEPALVDDEKLATQLAEDLGDPGRGILPPGEASVEAPTGTLVLEALSRRGWTVGEPWTPFRRDLSSPVPEARLRIETVAQGRETVRAEIHRASFDGSTFTEDRWRAMTSGLPYAEARCLVGFAADDAVAAVTVWSAGPGRPGLIEPLGVHRDHRGRGHGREITLAAAAALRDLGSSSAVVCTPSANAGAIATYRSAGFEPGPERYDRARP